MLHGAPLGHGDYYISPAELLGGDAALLGAEPSRAQAGGEGGVK